MPEKESKEPKSIVSRFGRDLHKEIKEIQQTRKDIGIDKKTTSSAKLTNMIPKHFNWADIKEDLINFKFNKKGLATLPIFWFILLGMSLIIILGVYLLIFNLVNDNLMIDVDVGQVNLANVTADTFGKINQGFIDNADFIGYSILFGMILFMIGSAFALRGNYPKIMIAVDIIILIFVFIVAVYVSNSYEILIGSSSYLALYQNNMPKTSSFILNLPTYIGIIGAVLMIVSYASIPRDRNEAVNLGESFF